MKTESLRLAIEKGKILYILRSAECDPHILVFFRPWTMKRKEDIGFFAVEGYSSIPIPQSATQRSWIYSQSTYFPRDETGLVCLPTQLERTATLLVMVNVMRGGGRAPPTLTSQGNFTLMTECTPESSGCYSVYSVDIPLPNEAGRVDGWPNTSAHLASWRRVTQRVWCCTWWTGRTTCLFRTVTVALTGAAQLRADGISSCWCCHIVNASVMS